MAKFQKKTEILSLILKKYQSARNGILFAVS